MNPIPVLEKQNSSYVHLIRGRGINLAILLLTIFGLFFGLLYSNYTCCCECVCSLRLGFPLGWLVSDMSCPGSYQEPLSTSALISTYQKGNPWQVNFAGLFFDILLGLMVWRALVLFAAGLLTQRSGQSVFRR